jgi:hypothetical protein
MARVSEAVTLPPLYWTAMIVALIVTALVIRWVRDSNRRAAEAMLADWISAFPGKCPLCSFHRMAVLHGHKGKLGEHYCIEGNSVTIPQATIRY